MGFWASIDIISTKLSAYLDSVTLAADLNVNAIADERKSLSSSALDTYSGSLLCTGIKPEHRALFANVPYSRYRWIIGDNIEKIFAAMGLPTTQAQAYKLANELNRKGVEGALTKEQLNALRGFSAVREHFEKVSKWCLDAREVNDIVKGNLSLLETVTDEEREFAKSLSFDWHYSYSDDIEVYRRGSETHSKVNDHVRSVLAEKPYLRKVVETVAIANGFNASFFTGR